MGEGQRQDYTYYVVEQFVSQVLDFSSQYGSDASISYTAHNIVGKPTKFPSYGDFSQTFVMRDYGPWWRDCPSGQVFRSSLATPAPSQTTRRAANFIDVKFEHAVYPFRIHVYETYNPGGLVSIWAGDCGGRWRQLWAGEGTGGQSGTVSQQPRQFSPPIQPTDFPTKLIRLEFDAEYLSYYTEIDAICLLGTLDPIIPSAKAAALLPARLSPLMSRLVSRGLHVLPPVGRVVQACRDQLSRPALDRFIMEQRQRELGPVKNNGYFDLLPREVIVKILSYLDLSSLVQVSALSSTFRWLSYDPWLYIKLDLRQVFHCTSSASLSWIKPRATKLSCLDLSWCGNYGSLSPASLSTFLTSVASSLTRLCLDNCHIATGAVLTSLTRSNPPLTHLSLANCHLLKPQDFQPLTQLDSLVSLNLYRTSIQQACVISILCNNRSLLHLSLAACNNIHGDEVCIVLGHCQPHLQVLDLWRCSSLTGRGVSALALGCHHLTDLDLGWCLNVQASSGSILALSESCHDLRRLLLTAHRQTGDRELAALANLKKLQQLDILGNRNVSLAAVSDLLARVTSLKLLDVSFCHQLGETNIGQLISQYPHVSIKWSFTDSL